MTTLSRLDCEGFVKNFQYAVAYWEENRENFKQMLSGLMSEETLLKVTENTSALCLRFNHQKKDIPDEYNQKIILAAYEVLEKKLNRDILFDGLNSFMEVLARCPEGTFTVPLASLFNTEFGKEKMHSFVEVCMGTEYDVESCYNYFVPQLIMFFIRFLDIYDKSLEGALVEDYLKGLPHRMANDKSEDPQQIRSIWGKMKQQKEEQEKEIKAAKEHLSETADAPILDTAKDENDLSEEQVDEILKNYPQFTSKAASSRRSEKEKETKQRAGAKNELHYLERSAEKGWELLLDQWRVRGPDFLHKWREFLDEERKEHLGEARKFLLIMGGGSYASAVLYCPELSVDELAANKGTPFLLLAKKCMADPKTTPDDFVNKFLSGFGDVDKDGTKNNSLSMAEIITVSRRFILLSFVSRVVCKVLDIPFTDLAPVTALVKPPGEKDNEDKKPSGEVPLFEVQPDLRMCSYPICEEFETKERSFPVCAYCKKVGKIVPYCSRECQGKDWAEHKKLCGGASAPPPSTAVKENVTTQPQPQEEKKVEELAIEVEAPSVEAPKGGGMAGID